MSDDPKTWWDVASVVADLFLLVASFAFAWMGLFRDALPYDRRAYYCALAAWLMVLVK